MSRYQNGHIPRSELVLDRHGNPWLPGTYTKWVQFQKDVHDRTGVWLYVSPKANGAYNTYRDYDGQVALRAWWGSIGMPLMASVPGKSSHGGVWTGQTNGRYGMPPYVYQVDAGAFDVANWASVPWDVFEECANRAGLRVNIVVPEERWHVVDPDPWGAPVAGMPATVGRPVTVDVEDEEEDDMYSEDDRKRDVETHDRVTVLWNAQRDADRFGRKGTVVSRQEKKLNELIDAAKKTLDRVTALYNSIRDADKFGRKGTVTERIDAFLDREKKR